MQETPNLKMPYIMPSQAQKHVTHNEALRMLDALVQLCVLDRHRTEPPADPAEGDRHIVAAAATGAWAGHDNEVALHTGGRWLFMKPRAGWTAWVMDELSLAWWSGSAWAVVTGGPSTLQELDLLGLGTVADIGNPFSARLNQALWTARYDGDGGDGDLRFKLNKEAAAGTVSVLMQSDWGGRAELGLIGDDDFVVKVSSDGTNWKEALRVDGAAGTASFPQTGALASIVANLFEKADAHAAAFAKTGAGTLDLKAGTIVELAGFLHVFASAEAVQMPTLDPGTDYAVYVCNDGTVRADASFSAPDGFDTATSRRIGGFHYASGGNAPGTAGGDATPAINEYSLWDLKWRPACPDPRGMALVAGAFWCDIYLLGVNHHVDGTSRNGVVIADGAAPPKIPIAFGGDGSAAYSKLTWFDASEVMKSHGKSLPDYAEFAAATYGTTEITSRGNDPVTTGLGTTNAGSSNADRLFTSRWGIIQAIGCLWVWGRDLQYQAAGADMTALAAFSWKDQTASRGQILTQNTAGISAGFFGGDWFLGTNAGSRASFWSAAPWASYNNLGARGRADHLRFC